jgi:sporulation protein YlmC with PRC-barrel domain
MTGHPWEPRTGDALDAVLHLMDRQVVDRDGRMVCKVDDVELTEHPDGSWEVTGLLVGPPALIPRYGGRLGGALEESWRRLGLQEGNRLVPWRIGLTLVSELGSGVTLLAAREGLLERQSDSPPAPGDVRRRLNDVLQLEVHGPDGGRLGRVLDVRLRTHRREPLELIAGGLVVGRGRPGGYLGYDRDGKQGPLLLNRLVRRIHRHSGYVPMRDVVAVDWNEQTLTVAAGLHALDHP